MHPKQKLDSKKNEVLRPSSTGTKAKAHPLSSSSLSVSSSILSSPPPSSSLSSLSITFQYLREIAFKGDEVGLSSILSKNPNILLPCIPASTPFSTSLQSSTSSTLKTSTLIDSQSKLEVEGDVDEYGRSVLHYACASGNTQCARLLLDRVGKCEVSEVMAKWINSQDTNGITRIL